jgi:hypothetical protein
LAHQLELGVTAAARDRLLEQMQRGYGEDDYSAIARKYFADIQPAHGEEANLELFERPAVPEIVEPHGEVTEPIQPDTFVPMMPEIAQESETAGDAIVSAPETAQPTAVSEESMPAPVLEETIPQEESSAATVIEETTSVAPDKDVQEEETPRGFLNRLLKRDS